MSRSISFTIGANIQKFSENLNKAQKKLTSFGRKSKRMGSKFNRNLTMPLGMVAGASLKMASDFESSMTKIQTLVGLSSDKVNQMKGSVMELSNQTGRSSKELSEALFVVTSAGIRGAESMEVLEMSAKASAVGLGETKDIAKAVTGVMQSYGKENLSASEATDVLLRTVREGNLEASELAPVLGKVTGIASQLGISFQEVGANIATFTRLGVSSAEAVTSLRGVMNSLIKPSQEGKKVLGEMGMTFEELRGKVADEGLASTLEFLTSKFEGNEEGLSKVIPSVEALSNVMGTAGAQGKQYSQIVDSITNSNEGLDNAFEGASKTISHKFNRSLEKLRNIGIKLGTKLMPVFEKLLEKVEAGADWFSSLSEQSVNFGLAIAGIVASLGPALVMLGTLSTALGAISLPIVGVIAGFGALASAILYIVDNFEAFKERFSDLSWWRNAIIDMVQFMIEYSPISMMIKGMNKVVSFFGGVEIPNPFEGVADKLDDLKVETKDYKHEFGSFGEAIKNGFKGGFDWVSGKFDELTAKGQQVKAKLKAPASLAVGAPSYSPLSTGGAPDVDTSIFRRVNTESNRTAGAIDKTMDKYRGMSEELANNIAPMIGNSIADMSAQFVQGIADIAVSGGSFKSVMYGILTTLADLAIRVGKIALGVGLAIEGIKKALETLNPVVAIGAGLALIAVGQFAKSALKKASENAGGSDNNIPKMASGGIIPSGYPNDTYPAYLSSGETVIPPKELNNLGGGMSETSMTRAMSRALAGAKLKASGSDLLLVMNNAGATYR